MPEFSYNTGSETYWDLTELGYSASIDGAIFQTQGAIGSSGTGLIQAFVRVQATGTEDGYNTTHRPLSYDENSSPSFTTSLTLADVPKLNIAGTLYYEFRLDINQTNNNPLLSLNELKLYKATTGDVEGLITSGTFDAATTLVWDLDDQNLDGTDDTDNTLLMNYDLQAGSGKSDMFFYVPVADFGVAPADEATTYVVLYSSFGETGTLDAADGAIIPASLHGDYSSNDGFEEWSVSKLVSGPLISGYKFHDLNGNGMWDGGELGLGGWKIDYTITYTTGQGSNEVDHVEVGSVTTNGDPLFDANGDGMLNAQDIGYYVIPVPPGANNQGYTITLTEVFPDPTLWVNTYDGDATPNTTTTFSFSEKNLTDGDIKGDYGQTERMNFGNFEKFSISGHKFTDITGNGLTVDDTGLGGVTIFIDMTGNGLTGDDPQTTTADGTTDANNDGVIDDADIGYWELTGLTNAVNGKEVKEVTPAGYVQTVGQIGTVTDTTASYTLVATSGNDRTGIDFANFQLFDISGYKWNDSDGDGMWDGGEPGKGDWTIFLYRDTDDNTANGYEELVAQTDTDGNGKYQFLNLGPGDYLVVEDLTDADWTNTYDGTWEFSGASGVDRHIDPVTTTPGNFGNFQLFDISGYKWNDSDGDGMWDGGEPGKGDWTIFLYRDTDDNTANGYEELVAQTDTDGNGKYQFLNLGPGDYLVVEDLTDADWTNTYDGTWEFSGASGVDRHIDPVTTTPGNFGNFQLFDISGYKWNDSDGDGMWDGGEPGKGSWTIFLYRDTDDNTANGYEELVAQTDTDGNGKYQFLNLGPGDYLVVEDLTDADWTNTYDGTWEFSGASGVDRHIDPVTTTPGNFGNFQLFDISGYKFVDTNGDGDWDGGEPVKGSWTIYLRKDTDDNTANGYEELVGTTTTDAVTGKYTFNNLGPGNYQVTEAAVAGWVNTYDGTWEFSGASGVNLHIDPVTTTPGNFGNFELMNVSGYKWNDINNDGMWSGGEGTLATWTIVLDNDDNPDNGNIATAVTNGSGFYQFTNLGPDIDTDGDGTVYVYEIVEDGFQQTYGNFSFNIESGLVIEGSIGVTEPGNFGNHMLGGYVRTPGFWQNKTWQDFWDGDVSVPKQAGQTGFPGETDLLILGGTTGSQDSNGDGMINGNDKGLLIGDWNLNGVTDLGEDTLFIKFNDALSLVKAGDNEMNGNKGNAMLVLGRDVMATWLNYLAGANVDSGTAPADLTPKHFIDDAVDWLQQFASDDNDAASNQAIFQINDPKVAASSPAWQTPQAGIDHSASILHAELDYFNNTGSTYDPTDPSMIYHFSLHAP